MLPQLLRGCRLRKKFEQLFIEMGIDQQFSRGGNSD